MINLKLSSRIFLILVSFFIFNSAFVTDCGGWEIIERVVAYVDDTAITFSEFQERFENMKKSMPDITEREVIDSMINRLLLLRQAKIMRLEGATEDEILSEYIDIKIRSVIFIQEDSIRQFFMENKDKFEDTDYLLVRDEIEKYLFELETNKKLRGHIEELRSNTEIKINLWH